MAQRREKKAPPGKERRPIKKKTSILITESIDYIDYKDVNLLRRFMSERAKVRARRVTGNTQQQQVAVAKAIRVAREMALLPYSVRQVTQRSKGRRDRGERGDRGDRGDREGELRDIPGPIVDDERRRLATRPWTTADARRGHASIEVESEFDECPGDDGGASAEGDDVMRIVLRDDVDNLGKKGDLVDVADGYARNYLVPRGLALKASAGSQKQADAMRRNREARERRDRESAQALAAQFEGRTISIKARAGGEGRLFGSVTSADIAEAVQKQTGAEIDRRKLDLDEPLKELGGVDAAGPAAPRRRGDRPRRGRSGRLIAGRLADRCGRRSLVRVAPVRDNHMGVISPAASDVLRSRRLWTSRDIHRRVVGANVSGATLGRAPSDAVVRSLVTRLPAAIPVRSRLRGAGLR